MSASSIYLASSAATVVNAFIVAAMWRGQRIEAATGKNPWWVGAIILGYCAGAGSFIYYYRGRPVNSPPELFMAGLVGQMMGVVLVFTIIQAVWPTENSPWPNRTIPAVLALILGGIFFIPAFLP